MCTGICTFWSRAMIAVVTAMLPPADSPAMATREVSPFHDLAFSSTHL